MMPAVIQAGRTAYAAAFKAAKREKVECSQFTDEVLSEVRAGRR